MGKAGGVICEMADGGNLAINMRAMQRERAHGVTDAYSGGSRHRLKKDFSFCDRWDISNLAVVLRPILCPNMS